MDLHSHITASSASPASHLATSGPAGADWMAGWWAGGLVGVKKCVNLLEANKEIDLSA